MVLMWMIAGVCLVHQVSEKFVDTGFRSVDVYLTSVLRLGFVIWDIDWFWTQVDYDAV